MYVQHDLLCRIINAPCVWMGSQTKLKLNSNRQQKLIHMTTKWKRILHNVFSPFSLICSHCELPSVKWLICHTCILETPTIYKFFPRLRHSLIKKDAGVEGGTSEQEHLLREIRNEITKFNQKILVDKKNQQIHE